MAPELIGLLFFAILVALWIAYALGSRAASRASSVLNDIEVRRIIHDWDERLRLSRACHLRDLINVRRLQASERGALDQYLVDAINRVPVHVHHDDSLADVV